jgi:hypothetical protein
MIGLTGFSSAGSSQVRLAAGFCLASLPAKSGGSGRVEMIIVYVREIETKQFTGLFWAPNHDELWWLVDQYGDPSGFEYCKVDKRGGSIVLSDNENTDVWMKDDDKPFDENHVENDDEDDEGPFRSFSASFDEYAISSLEKSKKMNWKRFDFADVGHGGVAQIFREVDVE